MIKYKTSLLEIHESQNPGFVPVVDSGQWRVALMNYTPDLLPDQITEFQRHDETDEVFVLLQGHCILFLGEGGDQVTHLRSEYAPLHAIQHQKRCLAFPYLQPGR